MTQEQPRRLEMDLEVGALVDADRDHQGGVQDGERTERPALAAGQSAQAGVLRESGDGARPGGRVTSCNGAGKDSSARPLFKARTSQATGAASPRLVTWPPDATTTGVKNDHLLELRRAIAAKVRCLFLFTAPPDLQQRLKKLSAKAVSRRERTSTGRGGKEGQAK
jgi:hypothetical protein